MKFFLKKRFFLLLLIVVLLLLFYNTSWLGRIMYPIKYKDDIQLSAQEYKVDPILIASVIRVESNYNPEMVSKKNALGLMQLMPQTAEWIVSIQQLDPLSEELLLRADVNINLGAWYLSYLYKTLENYIESLDKHDQIAVIAAAYNAGQGNVLKWLEGGRWDGRIDNLSQVPFGETRHYVQRILYYYKKYEELYDLERT
ncbi:lytic transglycosylase domain-containing protein [Marinicrinis lubricantis]|uniref:Lytic transglycosylase domain-containing protein n=1 Tax=Marinicrinis lubricantis TaxID=2086470 RepID=A0ABW1IIC4_9BACL